MESERLYQVQKEDLPKLENLLTQCFREDPLYHRQPGMQQSVGGFR